MYQSYTATDYKKHLGFSENYRIDGMLVYGAWNRSKNLNILTEVLKEAKQSYEINNLPNFLDRMVEIKINNKIFWFDCHMVEHCCQNFYT